MVRFRRGFTLLELLVVVVIIGILAAIAIPKFANTRDKAYVTTMKSDLRNLVLAQEGYFADYTTYTTSLGTVRYNSSSGVTVTISGADGTGWSATATHQASPKTCGIYFGTGTAPIPGEQPGVPVCQ